MHKELIICIILVTLIIIGDWIIQNYTKNTINNITGELETLKQCLFEKSDKNINEQIDRIDNKWNKVHDKLHIILNTMNLKRLKLILQLVKVWQKQKSMSKQ